MIKFWLLPVLWAAVIYTFSSLQVQPSSQFYWHDFVVKKSAHITEYAILFLLLYRALLNTTKLKKFKSAIVAFVFVALYGISDEVHQSFTPGRGPSPRDVLFDALGGGLAWFGIWKLLPKAPKRLKNLAKILQIN